MARVPILVAIPLEPLVIDRLESAFAVTYARAGLDAVAGDDIRAIVTNGSSGLTAQQMARFPRLGIVCCFGAGYENVDVAAARQRGIAVTHAPGTNDATVADHTLALMLALARDLVARDRAVREGRWKTARAPSGTLTGARLGLLGLGRIGSQIAKRAAGFDMEIAYHTRTPKPDAPWSYRESAIALARGSDFLVVACPGGRETRHLVGREVLAALGPHGFLVNIARGSVVDTAALIDALGAGAIAGAGLDVVEGEPELPTALVEAPNVVLTPHMAGRSPAALKAQLDTLIGNLDAHFADRPLLTPVP
jgi:D-3-phosphoglycerate dehydrogenase